MSLPAPRSRNSWNWIFQQRWTFSKPPPNCEHISTLYAPNIVFLWLQRETPHVNSFKRYLQSLSLNPILVPSCSRWLSNKRLVTWFATFRLIGFLRPSSRILLFNSNFFLAHTFSFSQLSTILIGANWFCVSCPLARHKIESGYSVQIQSLLNICSRSWPE